MRLLTRDRNKSLIKRGVCATRGVLSGQERHNNDNNLLTNDK